MITIPNACRHPNRGIPWRMQATPGGEVRRVRLCVCGQTTTARLSASGTAAFDSLALRQDLFERPVLVIETQD